MTRFGIGSYTYTWALGVPGYDYDVPRMGVDDLFDKAVAYGCGVVQICDNVDLTGLAADGTAALRRRAEECGLALHVGTRGVTPDHLLRFLDIAIQTGSELVRSMLPKTGPGSDIGEATAFLAEVMPLYERRGILLSLENHDRHTCRELRRLVDAIDSPNLGICLDTVNSFGAAEDPERVMDALLPVANCLHIKDFTICRVDHQMGFMVVGTPAGKGMLDIRRAFDGFADACPNGAAILELWTPYQGSTTATMALEAKWAEESVAFLSPPRGRNEYR